MLIPNAALRYAPTADDSTGNGGFLNKLLPHPPFRAASQQEEETGRNRTVWVLKDGTPTKVKLEIGSSDGKRTEVTRGELQAEQAVIVDQSTGKR